MKRIDFIQHISIVTIMLFMIVLSSLFSCKRNTTSYQLDPQKTLKYITTSDYIVSFDEIIDTSFVLIDVRNPIEFEKGHIDRSINKYTPDLLNVENIAFFDDLKEKNRTIVLYGKNPNDVTTPFMLLYQLGYENIKMLAVENYYVNNELRTKNASVENSVADIKAYIAESSKKAAFKPKPKPIVKKIVPKKKKKKMPVEGGC